jgi:hypothetical protein
MSSSKSSHSGRSDDKNDGWRNISNNQIVKPWGGMINFMHSYGLKEYNAEDFDEAHAIIDSMKQNQWDSMSASEKDTARAHRAKYKY